MVVKSPALNLQTAEVPVLWSPIYVGRLTEGLGRAPPTPTSPSLRSLGREHVFPSRYPAICNDRGPLRSAASPCLFHYSPITVSYTHLDVYKRQAPTCESVSPPPPNNDPAPTSSSSSPTATRHGPPRPPQAPLLSAPCSDAPAKASRAPHPGSPGSTVYCQNT